MAISLRGCLSRVFPSFKNSTPLIPLFLCNTSFHKQHTLRYCNGKIQTQEIVSNFRTNEISKEVIAKVNDQIANKSHGRLFAVVYIHSTQFKVTTDDIIVIQGCTPPTIGDKIRLEKVLLLGSSDFTLIGRPLLPLDQVAVHATVIEKTWSHARPVFRFRKRKNFMKCNFYKMELTYLRINSIVLTGNVNELGDSDGFKNRLFPNIQLPDSNAQNYVK